MERKVDITHTSAAQAQEIKQTLYPAARTLPSLESTAKSSTTSWAGKPSLGDIPQPHNPSDPLHPTHPTAVTATSHPIPAVPRCPSPCWDQLCCHTASWPLAAIPPWPPWSWSWAPSCHPPHGRPPAAHRQEVTAEVEGRLFMLFFLYKSGRGWTIPDRTSCVCCELITGRCEENKHGRRRHRGERGCGAAPPYPACQGPRWGAQSSALGLWGGPGSGGGGGGTAAIFPTVGQPCWCAASASSCGWPVQSKDGPFGGRCREACPAPSC